MSASGRPPLALASFWQRLRRQIGARLNQCEATVTFTENRSVSEHCWFPASHEGPHLSTVSGLWFWYDAETGLAVSMRRE